MWTKLNENPDIQKYTLFERVKKLGDFEDKANAVFKEKYPWFNIRTFSTRVDEWKIETDGEKSARDYLQQVIERTESIIKDYETISQNRIAPDKIEETIDILLSSKKIGNGEFSYSNLMLLPNFVANDLRKKKSNFNTLRANEYQKNIIERLKSIDSSFINKEKITSFLVQENFFDRKIALEAYINFLEKINSQIRGKIIKKITSWKIDIDESEQSFWLELYKNIAQISTLFNYDSTWLIPIKTKEYFNQVAYDGLKKWYYDSQSVYLYVTTEEGIFWVQRKTVKDGSLWENNRIINNQDYFKGYDTYFRNLVWIGEIENFLKTHGNSLQLIINSPSIDTTLLQKYEIIFWDFHTLLERIRLTHWYLPWEYLEMKDRLENIKSIVYAKAPEWTAEAEKIKKIQKMVRFLETCRIWMDAKWKSKSEKESIDAFIKKVKSGSVTGFSDLKNENGYLWDSNLVNIIQEFTYDVQSQLEKSFRNSDGINDEYETFKKNGLAVRWFTRNINMKELDSFIDLFTTDSWNSLFYIWKIESALGQSFDSNQDSIWFQMMVGEIMSDIEKNPEALRRINSLDPTRIKKMKEELQNEFTKPSNTTYQDFQKQVREMTRSAQEKILLAKKPWTQISPNTSIEKDVVNIIIEEAAENWAVVALKMWEVKTLFNENRNMFSNHTQKFLAHITDDTRWVKEVWMTILKEAALFIATEIVTMWVGGFIAGGARASLWLSRGLEFANSAKWISGWIIRTSGFLWRTWFEAGVYTLLSNGVNKWKISVEWYTEALVGFLWPIAGAKVAWKFIPYGSSEFSNIIKQIIGGSIWGAGSHIVLQFVNGKEISAAELPNMVLQWAVLWALMIPMMKIWAPIWEWFWKKTAGINYLQDGVDSLIKSRISALEIATNWQKSRILQDIYDLQVSLTAFHSETRFARFWLKGVKLEKYSEILARAKNFDFDGKSAELTLLRKEKSELIWNNQNNKRLFEVNQKIGNLEKEIRTMQQDLERVKKELWDNLETTIASIDSNEIRTFVDSKLWEVAPLSRLRWEISRISKLSKLKLEKYWNEFGEMRLDWYRSLLNMRWATYIENWFYLNGRSLQSASGKTLFNLPEWIHLNSVEYLNIGNKRIPVIEVKTPTDTKMIRLSEEAQNLPSELFDKIIYGKVEIQWFYDTNNASLLWYKVIEWDGTFSYYRILKDGWIGKPTNTSFMKKEWFYLHTLASSKRITVEELSSFWIKSGEGVQLKRQWEKEIDSLLSDDVLLKMQRNIKKAAEEIQSNPNISPTEKTKLTESLLKVATMGLSPFRWIMRKWLWSLALWWAWVVGIDYAIDGDVDVAAIATGLAFMVLTDPNSMEFTENMLRKIPLVWWLSWNLVGWLNKDMINKNWFTKALFRVGGWFIAMSYVDKQNIPLNWVGWIISNKFKF
jgi:hypothetical protein